MSLQSEYLETQGCILTYSTNRVQTTLLSESVVKSIFGITSSVAVVVLLTLSQTNTAMLR
jgi:hypothetical protein